jgi:hypothetical protein
MAGGHSPAPFYMRRCFPILFFCFSVFSAFAQSGFVTVQCTIRGGGTYLLTEWGYDQNWAGCDQNCNFSGSWGHRGTEGATWVSGDGTNSIVEIHCYTSINVGCTGFCYDQWQMMLRDKHGNPVFSTWSEPLHGNGGVAHVYIDMDGSPVCVTNVVQSYHNSLWSPASVALMGSGGEVGTAVIVQPGGDGQVFLQIPCGETYSWIIQPVPGTTHTVNQNVQNNTGQTQTYQMIDQNGQPWGQPLTLGPGQSGTLTAAMVPVGDTLGTTANPNIFGANTNNDQFIIVTNLYDLTNGTMGDLTLSYPTNQQGASSFWGTNGMIIWSSNSTTPPAGSGLVFDQTVNNTLHAGFNAVGQEQKNQELLQRQANQLLALIASNRSVTGIFSNSLSGLVVTNNLSVSVSLSNLTGLNLSNVSLTISNFATESTLQGFTNLIAALLGATNFDYTTNYSDTNASYAVSGSDTNDVAAAAAASGQLSTVLGNFDTVNQQVGDGLNQTVPGGSEPNMNISWSAGNMAWTFDFNPVHQFPWAFTFSHAFLTWVLIVYFIKQILETLYQVIQDFAAAQTGGVPNLSAGGKR